MHAPRRYRNPGDLPAVIPVFPLTGVLLLPKTRLPLNIFEPRYLAMVDSAISSYRMIGMIQPKVPGEEEDAAKKPVLAAVGEPSRVRANDALGHPRAVRRGGARRTRDAKES